MPKKKKRKKQKPTETSASIKTDDVLTVLGFRGSGKSTLGKFLANKFPRVIIWNYMLESMPLGYSVSTPRELIDAINKKTTHIVYNPMHKSLEEFELVNQVVFQRAYNYCYYVEEADRFVKSKHMPFWFGELINRGRHHGIALICVARRIFRLNPDVPFNSNHIFVFGTIASRDLKYLEDIDERLKDAKNLPKYHYLWWQRGEKVVKCTAVDIKSVVGKGREVHYEPKV